MLVFIKVWLNWFGIKHLKRKGKANKNKIPKNMCRSNTPNKRLLNYIKCGWEFDMQRGFKSRSLRSSGIAGQAWESVRVLSSTAMSPFPRYHPFLFPSPPTNNPSSANLPRIYLTLSPSFYYHVFNSMHDSECRFPASLLLLSRLNKYLRNCSIFFFFFLLRIETLTHLHTNKRKSH